MEVSRFSLCLSHSHDHPLEGRFSAGARVSVTEAIQTFYSDQSVNTFKVTVPAPAPGSPLISLSSGAPAVDYPTATQRYSRPAVMKPSGDDDCRPYRALPWISEQIGDMPLVGTSKNGSSTMAMSATLSTSHLLYLILGVVQGLLWFS